MKDEEFDQIRNDAWNEIRHRYPIVTSDSIISRILAIFDPRYSQRLLWENGFLKGWLECQQYRRE